MPEKQGKDNAASPQYKERQQYQARHTPPSAPTSIISRLFSLFFSLEKQLLVKIPDMCRVLGMLVMSLVSTGRFFFAVSRFERGFTCAVRVVVGFRSCEILVVQFLR